MATAPQTEKYGVMGSFELGVDSDVDPSLLPPNQLSYATNATVRNNLIHQRPSMLTYALVGTQQTLNDFQKGLFQGSCYYRSSSINDGTIMCSVNGKLFNLTIGAGTITVTELALPGGDPGNSTTAQQNWMWQAEQFLIWNDGTNLPMYYDGQTMRRSYGQSVTTLGATVANFTVPPQGVGVGVQINSQWTGQTGIVVLVGGANYYVQSAYTGGTAAGRVFATFSAITGSGADLIAPGSLFTLSAYAGAIKSAVDHVTGATITNWPSNANNTMSLSMSGFSIPDGASIVGAQFWISSVSTGITSNSDSRCYIYGTVNSYTNNSVVITPSGFGPSAVAGGPTPTGNSYITFKYNFNSSPYTTTATTPVSASYGVWPQAGVPKFDLTLTTPFTGLKGDSLSQVSATMTVDSVSGNVITCHMTNNSTATAIPIYVSGTPTSGQLVKNLTHTGGALVATYPLDNGLNPPTAYSNVSVTGLVGGIYMTPSSSNYPMAGMIVSVPNTTAGTDLLYINSVTATQASTNGYFLTLINENDVVGAVVLAGAQIQSIPELPQGTCGCYGLGRNWMSLSDGQSFIGTDIVGSSSGSQPYKFTDSVLKVSQNYYLASGTTFQLPASGESIRAMQFVASLDASLGQGALQVFTDNTVFSCNAPTDANTWAKMTSPILTESIINTGAAGQSSVIQLNSDLFFRTSDGQIQSMVLARLDFNRWSNTPCSQEITRLIIGDDQSLLKFCSSAYFNNRAIFTCNPTQFTRGVGHSSIAALNMDPLSSINTKENPAWEGAWSKPNTYFLSLVSGFFKNRRRCFAFTLSGSDSTATIGVVELLSDTSDTFDDDTSTPIEWTLESPQLLNNHARKEYYRLIDGELWFKNIVENVTVTAYYKPDQSNVWTQWYGPFTITEAMAPAETGYRARIGLGSPSPSVMDSVNNRPVREGYDFQVKLDIVGACTLMGGRIMASIIPEPRFAKPS